MTVSKRVLVTDHPASTADVEAAVLATADAELVIAPATDPQTLAKLAADADAIITCFAKVTAPVLEAAPRCVTVARTGVGVDNIDVAAATRLGMVVSNVPEYCSGEVADHTMLLLMSLARRLTTFAADTAAGGWDRDLAPVPLRIAGRTLGLLGAGSIGAEVASRASAFGMTVIAPDRGRRLPEGVEVVGSTDELFARSDVLSLHLPLTEQTAQIIDSRALALMKSTALLINTARGGLIDTEALTRALESGALAGAGLDVTEPEPLPSDHRLRRLANVVLTPHVAFSSDGSLADLSRLCAQNVVATLAGERPASIVNPTVLSGSALRMKVRA